MTPRIASSHLARAAAGIPLGSFAMVMATGVTAVELRLAGQAQLAAATLVLAVTSFVVLSAAALAAIRHRRGPGSGTSAPRAHDRRRYKCQALVQLLPATEDGAEPQAGPVYRAVVYARHHGTGASELFNSQVTVVDDTPARPDVSVLVTLETFGHEPGDCLAPGDLLTIWRGRDLARGVVTRRIFV